jgi:hypothetical protein
MKPSHLHTSLSLLPPEEIALAKSCAKVDIGAPAVAAVLNVRNSTGNHVTTDQVRWLKRVEKSISDGELTPDASSTQKLVESFRKRKDVSFVNITFHKTHGLLLITNKERRQYRNYSMEDLNRLYDDNKARLGPDGWLLVMFVFAGEEEMRLIRMHPEFIACDTTFGTNNEIKELFTVAIKDGNNHAHFGARAYIPNSQEWVFDLLFSRALPELWTRNVTDRINLIVTDGCVQLRAAVLRNIGEVRVALVFNLCSF